MSRKTAEKRRSHSSRPTASQSRLCVSEMPIVERPLSLLCEACGITGKYQVGTVIIDPTVAPPAGGGFNDERIGFTGYFRCRKCKSGGPWKLTQRTQMYIMLLTIEATSDPDNTPLVLGAMATFDKHTFQYATEGEAHLKKLIDLEPERAFLWVQLGNLYDSAREDELAEAAFERAIELDPKDIEAHGMLGRLIFGTGRYLESVPHFHAVLKHVRDARQVNKDLRRNLARCAIEYLLEAHAETNGAIDLLPVMDEGEMENQLPDEPPIVEIREFDLCSEEGLDELCDIYLGQSR